MSQPVESPTALDCGGARPGSWGMPTRHLFSAVALLGALGFVELALCFYSAHAQQAHRITTSFSTALMQALPYGLASGFVLWRPRPSRASLTVILIFGAAFRLVALLGTQPYLSTDVYRYVWDGRVQVHGINPYRYPSSDPALAGLRDGAVFAKMNRPDARTIYPPGAEMIFLAAAHFGDRPPVMRWAMVVLEGLAVWGMCRLLRGGGMPIDRIALYLWHPLPIWEIAGSGHVDAALIAAVVLALLAVRGGRDGLAGVALGAAVLIKLFPAVLFAALYRRWGWKLPLAAGVTIILAYAYYLDAGIARVFDFLLHSYAKEEGLNSGERFFGLTLVNRMTGAALPGAAFQAGALLVLGGLAAWMFCSSTSDRRAPLQRAALLASVFTVLFSPGYAWYFVWLVPFLPFVARPSLWWLTCASFVLYANWLHTTLDEFFRIGCVLYLPAAVFFAVETVGGVVRRRNPPSTGVLASETQPSMQR